MRKLTALLVLAFALALPASTLAVEVTGTTNESFTLAAPSISMTVPGSVGYDVSSEISRASGAIHVTNISTSNDTGLKIEARFSVLSKTMVGAEATPLTIATTNREFDAATNLSGAGFLPPEELVTLGSGAIANATTWYTIADHGSAIPDPLAAAWTMFIYTVTVPGDYTGSIDFKASTNP
jgi:hypothetical protein